MRKEHIIKDVNLKNLHSTAIELLDLLRYNVVLMRGELGAGKTTLVKALLTKMGSSDLGSSPSYAIINKYLVAGGHCYHMDLYRLQTTEEAFDLGIEEMMYSGDRCYIEWPGLILDWIESPYHIIDISLQEDGNRQIVLTCKEDE